MDHTEANSLWQKNLEACKRAVEYNLRKDRPLEILALFGTGRHTSLSPGAETGNSTLLLETGLSAVTKDPSAHIERVKLREYRIEPCNGCLSTASSLCGFPCDCYPDDPMHRLYPMVLKADVLLISTPVNQSAMSSMLKLFVDRLISLDGGYFVDSFTKKDYAHRAKMISLSRGKPVHYDQRMFGKVAAYFVTSKDQNNSMSVLQAKEHPPKPYGQLVVDSLLDGFRDYGFYHSDQPSVIAAANPDEDYSYDKEFYSNDVKIQDEAREVVRKAVDLAKSLRENPPKWDGGARKNRT